MLPCHALYPGDGKFNEEDSFLHHGPHYGVWPEGSCHNLSWKDQLLPEVCQHQPLFALCEHSVPFLSRRLEHATRLNKPCRERLCCCWCAVCCYPTALQDVHHLGQELIMAPPEASLGQCHFACHTGGSPPRLQTTG